MYKNSLIVTIIYVPIEKLGASVVKILHFLKNFYSEKPSNYPLTRLRPYFRDNCHYVKN